MKTRNFKLLLTFVVAMVGFGFSVIFSQAVSMGFISFEESFIIGFLVFVIALVKGVVDYFNSVEKECKEKEL